MLAWHFVRSNMGLPIMRDGRRVVVGEWVDYFGPVVPCRQGLHASERALDALEHLEWEDGYICRVKCEGVIVNDPGKIACSRRKVIAMVPCDPILRAFARRCALDVIYAWDAPGAVRRYLETGDEEIRSAAGYAAGSAAESAARSAAESAARSAAGYAAGYAAESAAWSAAESAARSAAGYAAWSAAESAAWSAAESAARSAAGYAAESAQNAKLERMFLDAMNLR
jgi:hypothetical protein